MPAQTEFPLVFEKLRAIIKPYASKLKVKADTADSYYLEGKYSETYRNNLFFASTQIKKNYVSFYLMPVYMYPDLLKGISPELKKHMQGKSCFNFKKVEPELLDELTQLTKKGFDRLMKEEYS
jgi:hypothetical protein